MIHRATRSCFVMRIDFRRVRIPNRSCWCAATSIGGSVSSDPSRLCRLVSPAVGWQQVEPAHVQHHRAWLGDKSGHGARRLKLAQGPYPDWHMGTRRPAVPAGVRGVGSVPARRERDGARLAHGAWYLPLLWLLERGSVAAESGGSGSGAGSERFEARPLCRAVEVGLRGERS